MNYVVNGVLAAAVAVLFVLHFSDRKCTGRQNPFAVADDSSQTATFPIAYIRTDSMLSNYQFFLDLNAANMKELEDHQMEINRRRLRFEKEVEDFQQKVQLNVYITQERMRQVGEGLEKKREELERYAGSVEQSIAEKQIRLQRQLEDSVIAGLKLFNTPQRYSMIFSNVGTDNFYYVDEAYDITDEVVKFLNARYGQGKE